MGILLAHVEEGDDLVLRQSSGDVVQPLVGLSAATGELGNGEAAPLGGMIGARVDCRGWGGVRVRGGGYGVGNLREGCGPFVGRFALMGRSGGAGSGCDCGCGFDEGWRGGCGRFCSGGSGCGGGGGSGSALRDERAHAW